MADHDVFPENAETNELYKKYPLRDYNFSVTGSFSVSQKEMVARLSKLGATIDRSDGFETLLSGREPDPRAISGAVSGKREILSESDLDGIIEKNTRGGRLQAKLEAYWAFGPRSPIELDGESENGPARSTASALEEVELLRPFAKKNIPLSLELTPDEKSGFFNPSSVTDWGWNFGEHEDASPPLWCRLVFLNSPNERRVIAYTGRLFDGWFGTGTPMEDFSLQSACRLPEWTSPETILLRDSGFEKILITAIGGCDTYEVEYTVDGTGPKLSTDPHRLAHPIVSAVVRQLAAEDGSWWATSGGGIRKLGITSDGEILLGDSIEKEELDLEETTAYEEDEEEGECPKGHFERTYSDDPENDDDGEKDLQRCRGITEQLDPPRIFFSFPLEYFTSPVPQKADAPVL